MPNASVNGTEIYYEVHGEGPAVVFLHGVGGNHAIWWQQVPHFAQSYKVVTIDHRGFGRSKEIPEGADRREYTEDLKQLMDQLEIEKAALVGQSMGGIASFGMVAQHPERVTACVMADTIGSLDEPQVDAMTAEVRETSDKLSQFDRALSKGYQQREPVLTRLFSQINSFNKANRHNLRGQDYKGPTPEQVMASGIPIMFLVGQEDRVVAPEIVRRAHQLVKGSKLVEVPGSAHSVYWERPDLFNYLVDEFIKKANSKNGG